MLFALLTALATPSFQFTVVSGKGLLVQARGVPIIRGSGVQFYKPGWSKGYYSSTEGSLKIERPDPFTIKTSFTSDDGLSQGTITYHSQEDHLLVHYDLVWTGDEPANAEVNTGLLWSPPFENGTLSADNAPAKSLAKTTYKSEEIDERRFSPDASSYVFATPVGAVTEKSSIPLTLFDGRGSNKDWAKNNQYLWLGDLGLPLPKGQHVTFDVDYELDVTIEMSSHSVSGSFEQHPSANALNPDTEHPPLIPKPITAHLDWNHPLEYHNAMTFPAGVFDHLDLFKDSLARRFEIPSPSSKAPKIAFDAGISKLGLVPGGYKITITENSISVLGEEDEGLRNGFQRLASLAFVSHGKICFPTGFLRDQPHSKFRGVHLFVGKQAMPFQKRLWTRVLAPLGFNKAVLQCERTDWTSEPGIGTGETMAKADLIQLFAMYRSLGVDPIPLIESFGHMEWFFANGKNLDLALDPSHPYAIDPSNPKALEALGRLWDEVAEALHPDILHFGLDEVDMVGKKLTPAEKTEKWTVLLGALEKISRHHQAQMMLWGDEALAPGEGPDATNAETPKDAADRRNAVPKGALIGDWHYPANLDPTAYNKNLEVWKDAGAQPIASTWYEPNNIAGFDVEADRLSCGTLQTTWCGYESSEANLGGAFEQFTAMILAADYGWSGRTDPPSKLDYDPAQVFRKMYFGEPSPLVPTAGLDLGLPGPIGLAFQIGRIRYGSPVHLTIPSGLLAKGQGITGALLGGSFKARKLAIAMNSQIQMPQDGMPVAEIVIALDNGKELQQKLIYGINVRTADDARTVPYADRNSAGVCSLVLDLGSVPVNIRAIGFRPLNTYSGLEIKGLEAVN